MASRLAVHTTAAATLILLAACAIDGAAASQTQNFRDCFRWDNQTNNFQGGSDWYKAEACKNWFWSAFGWTVPAFIGLFVLLVFPSVFYCARVCCNCCGGRHRTYGVCCADDSSRHRFPGYSNRTILLAKLLMCAAFGGYTYYAVGGYVSNAHFHNHLIDSLDSMSASVDSVRDDLQRTASEAATLSILPERIIPSVFAADIKNVADGFGDRVSDIQNVLDKIRRAEDNQSWGRAESVYRYPSCVLFCFLLALFMMLCNLRKAIGPLMVLICLTSIVEGLVFIPHMILAQAMTGMCDSYNQSVVPVVVSAVASQKGCNDPAFFTALNDSAKMGLQPLFWHDANSSWTASSLCQDMQTVCSTYNCTYNTCGGASATGAALPFQRSGDPAAPFNIMAIQAVMETPFAKSTSPSAANVPPGTTIVSCAVSACPNGTAVQTAAINLMRFYKTSYPSLLFLYESAYPDSYNCNAVRGFMHEPMESNVCTDLNRDATNVAMTTGILYLISFLSLPVLIRGMKRFVAMQRGQPLKEVLRDTVVYADARVNAIPVREYTYVEGSAQPLDINGGGGNVSCGGGDDSHSPHSNYGTAGDEAGAGNGVSAARLGDAAYQRRFYGGFRAHGDADQPLINGDESMRTTDGNGIKQV